MYQYSFLIRASTHIVKKLKQTNNLQNCLTCNTQFPEVYPTQKTPPKNTHTHNTPRVIIKQRFKSKSWLASTCDRLNPKNPLGFPPPKWLKMTGDWMGFWSHGLVLLRDYEAHHCPFIRP